MLATKRNIDTVKILKAAEVLRVIGHPIRLHILSVLETETSLSVSDIQQKLDVLVEQSLLSHHLIKMKDKGVLFAEKQGVHMMYRIADRQILGIFDCLDGCKAW